MRALRSRGLLILVATATVFGMALSVAAQPSLDPESVEETLFPGESIDITKTVTTPEIPPSVDVCLLQDETGSFFDDIANLQSGSTAEEIYDGIVDETSDAQFAVAGFRDYPVAPFGSPGDHVYRLLSPMSAAKADWLAGIMGLSASGGGDVPEAQYDAIVAAVSPGTFNDPTLGEQPACGFRTDPDVTRVLVVATDATFHLPGPGKPHVNDETSTVAALTVNDVIVIGMKAPGAGTELDALATATGGSVQPLSSDSENIVNAIVAGLAEVEIEVGMASDCVDPITTTFAPEIQTVISGDDAVFTETISVGDDAPGGTYTCQDWALVNGSPMVDETGATIFETKTISVPEGFLTGGGQIGRGSSGHNFGGNVGFLADFSLVGQWQFNGRDGGNRVKLHSTSFTSLQFTLDPPLDAPPPDANANVADFEGTARVKVNSGPWLEDCRFSAHAEDHGEPGRGADVFGIDIDCTGAVGGEPTDMWSFSADDLDAGNLQIHSGLKD